MRVFLILFFLVFSFVGHTESGCEAELDAFVGKYEVYRLQDYHAEISRCVPSTNSFIQLKSNPNSKLPIDGFVVGIESFWHPELHEVVKVVSKTGAHTTLVTLLAYKDGDIGFSRDFMGLFSSSMDYIFVSKSGSKLLSVNTRNNYHEDGCQLIYEDTYELTDLGFEKISTSEIARECK